MSSIILFYEFVYISCIILYVAAEFERTLNHYQSIVRETCDAVVPGVPRNDVAFPSHDFMFSLNPSPVSTVTGCEYSASGVPIRACTAFK